MSAAVTNEATESDAATNVIPVEFRSPVLVDFESASSPKGEIAQRLAAEAAESAKGLVDRDKKVGALRVLASSKSDLVMLNPYLLRIKDGWNSRVANDPSNMEHVDMLARSIAEIGVQQPLTVTMEDDVAYVTDGHCRLLATFRAIEVYGAEVKSVPVRAEGRFATEADRVLSQIVRNSGKPLTVLEQGAVFVKLIALGWTENQIATKAGLGLPRVKEVLSLMENASEGIKTLIAQGKVSATTATTALRDAGGDADFAEAVLEDAVKVAKSSGKKKATMKHVKAAKAGDDSVEKVSRVGTLRAIFEGTSTEIEKNGRRTTVTMNSSHWNQIVALLKLNL